MDCMSKTSPADSHFLDYTGPEGFRFDDQGMILPHSILGSPEDFKRYLEAKGETELVQRIQTASRDPPCEATGRHHHEAVEKDGSGRSSIQSHALQHWDKHMRHRKQQQNFLSGTLKRPVENLLMNQSNHFRETQEQREFLNQVMPLVNSGYGYRVGSEFWSLPQRYGDEMSGITATLSQTEQGRRGPVTHVGQPNSIRQESGITCAETLRPASRIWNQSAYLQQQLQMLGEVLQDMDTKKPDISGLEVIGSGKAFTFVTMCRSPSLEIEEEEKERKEMKMENIDPLGQYEDAQSDVLHVPALRFCGQLARWTGNSNTNEGEVGISATIVFEAPTGGIASSHLELGNEGSTAIFYSWQQLPVPHSFPSLRSQTKTPHFYFSSSSGVIRPGDTQRVEFIFKSEEPGITTEHWQLNTHPVMLQGALMQVRLRGLALYQDKTADQRDFIETKLEKKVLVKECRSMVYELLWGLHTPERPSSPADLYVTADQQFLSENPKLQYIDQSVEDLKRLWQEANHEHTWDLSVDTLRQAVLSLPDEDSAQDSLGREGGLTQLNAVFLQLCEPSEVKHHPLTAATIGQQLWRKLLDSMAAEAVFLRNLLGLPERAMWIEQKDEPTVCDADLADDIKTDEKSEKKAGTAAKVERSGSRSRVKDDNKEESKSPANEKSVEETKKRGKRRDEVLKQSKEKQGKESLSVIDNHPEIISQQSMDDPNLELEIICGRLLHRKVYALMEDLVDDLCHLMDELNERDSKY
ncbi:MYCBP-associated protein isoform X2 [Mugil cephalus]|uniref:MYCBP-associated protein isoform X2 n=1 Tax=Mugil cephalus TaxID=48193 RepID=UPI001FB6C0B3|nr:MYCBP-associated protein isoform X2 [Mugil cephalus]